MKATRASTRYGMRNALFAAGDLIARLSWIALELGDRSLTRRDVRVYVAFKLNSRVAAVVLVFMATLPHPMSAQGDPELGTWTLNPAKSTYDPGPPLKTQIRTVEKAGDGQRLRNETVTADGRHAVVRYTAKFDGKGLSSDRITVW